MRHLHGASLDGRPVTDYETIELVLQRAGVPFERRSDGVFKTLRLDTERGSERVIGYNGFFTVLFFREDGRLDHVGIWE